MKGCVLCNGCKPGPLRKPSLFQNVPHFWVVLLLCLGVCVIDCQAFEVMPFLVMVIGLDNISTITTAVVNAPPTVAVRFRIAHVSAVDPHSCSCVSGWWPKNENCASTCAFETLLLPFGPSLPIARSARQQLVAHPHLHAPVSMSRD